MRVGMSPSGKKWAGSGAAAIGGALLANFVIPVAQQQHPELFADAWVLWVSTAGTVALFVPACIQSMYWFFGFMRAQYGETMTSWVLILLVGATVGMGLFGFG